MYIMYVYIYIDLHVANNALYHRLNYGFLENTII